MLAIDKKKGATLLVSALLITALLVITMSGPTSAIDLHPSNLLHLDGPSLAPIHMHCDQGILGEGLMFPLGTTWHELHPEFCENWTLTSWIDSEWDDNDWLSFGDQIDMTNMETEEVHWYFVDYVTVTMRLYSEFYDETIYVELKQDFWEYQEYFDPVGTNWTEIYPTYLGVTGGPYKVVVWSDNGDGYISYCDNIGFAEFVEVWWHVEEYATDLVLNEKVRDPARTIWHELYPSCCINDYNLTHWIDSDGDEVLSPDDLVTTILLPEGPAEDCRVVEATLTLNLTLLDWMGMAPEFTDRIYIELNTTYLQDWEFMWWGKIMPYDFDWYVICVPGEPMWAGAPLFVNFWEDNCNGVLDYCDFIELLGPEFSWWCHVEEVCFDILLGPACATVDGYKPPFNDYAQSGVPDFDQKQDEWYLIEQWTWCGPTAVANSLWWMDSRFEDPESPPPPEISDSFVMVTRYDMAWDDHDPQNAPRFIEDLAWYMDTDGIRTGSPHAGTNVLDMYDGIIQYLTDRGLQNVFEVNMMEMPPFDFVEHEIERCEDVILLLGLWQYQEPGVWVRFGGHYVTAAGVWSDIGAIAFSDPFIDNAEVTGVGRVLPPHTYPHSSTVHNNATFVSHDTYYIGEPSPSPGGLWFIPDYYVDPWWNFQGQNDNPFFEPGPYDPMYSVAVEVEWMVTISPEPCKRALLGDADGDGFVNVWDLGALSDAWLSQIGDDNFDPRVDFNFDGLINVWDLGILSDQWLKAADPCP